jgi:hypothetical protein
MQPAAHAGEAAANRPAPHGALSLLLASKWLFMVLVVLICTRLLDCKQRSLQDMLEKQRPAPHGVLLVT